MMPALVKLMWLEAGVYWLDMLIAAVVGAFVWHWLCKGWRRFMTWVLDRKGKHYD